ncbi:MAG: DinB family protein [Cyclobacteriaceae bacterium]
MENPLLIQFNLHHRLFNNVLEGFTDYESNQRLNGSKQINHVKYLAGHLLNSNYGLAIMAGMNADVIKWNELFAVMGQSEAKDDITYPTIEEIVAEWNQLYPVLLKNLSNMSTEALNAKPPAPFDQVADSSVELWAFINHHIAYHIGQIGILRRGIGKNPMHYD